MREASLLHALHFKHIKRWKKHTSFLKPGARYVFPKCCSFDFKTVTFSTFLGKTKVNVKRRMKLKKESICKLMLKNSKASCVACSLNAPETDFC
jgi:hypothetical protein